MNKAEGDSHELGRTLELEGNWKENSNKSLKSLRLCEHLKKDLQVQKKVIYSL